MKIVFFDMEFANGKVPGSIYSFGFTLLVGTIFNLLLGVVCSRLMVKSISRLKIFRKPAFYGGAKNV